MRSTKLAFPLLVLLLLGGVTARATGARDILRRAEQVRSPAIDYVVEFTLHAVDPGSSWKERTARYTLIAHGKDHSLVMMREPKAFYPGTLLIDRGYYWMLLPRSTKAFQLAPRHVLNGDVSNGDLARGNLLSFYEPQLDGTEVVRGQDCWRLELTRTSNLGMYKRIRAWISKQDYRPLRLDYYGNTDTRLKTAWYEEYVDGELGLRSMRITVENHVRPTETTTLTFHDLRRFDSSRLVFSVGGMMALRDAAIAIQIESQEQASAEQLATRLGSAPEATAP